MEDSKNTPEEIKAQKQAATLVPKFCRTIEEAVNYLILCRLNGENVYIEYNGNFGKEKLYSCDVTKEKAYLQITGLTKQELEECEEEIRKAQAKGATPEELYAIEDKYDLIRKMRRKTSVEAEIASINKEMEELKARLEELQGQLKFIDEI